MSKRTLTLIVEVEQPEGNWLWDMLLKEKDGVIVREMYEGHCVDAELFYETCIECSDKPAVKGQT